MGKTKKKFAGVSGVNLAITEVNKIFGGTRKDRSQSIVAQIVRKILEAMKKQSPNVFGKFFNTIFGGGSSFEGLKIGSQGDYDIDILLKIPEETDPVLLEDTIPGYVQLQLQNFKKLENKQPELYEAMKEFVDHNNYLLTAELKSTFMQSIFDKAHARYFPGGRIAIGLGTYKITRVQITGPALTVTIERADFFLQIDLVPCIVLPGGQWPKDGFRENPYKPSDFFIVPKAPKREHPHLERYFRLSFQKQERQLMFNQFWMKPTIRIMKSIRNRFEQQVSSYAIKTLFMWKQQEVDTYFWQRSPRLCLIDMLKEYSACLEKGTIWYFWNTTKKLNLLDNLSKEQISRYKKDVDQVITAFEEHASKEVILAYLRTSI